MSISFPSNRRQGIKRYNKRGKTEQTDLISEFSQQVIWCQSLLEEATVGNWKCRLALLKSYPPRLVTSSLGPATQLMEQTAPHENSSAQLFVLYFLQGTTPQGKTGFSCVWKTWNNVWIAAEFISTGTGMNWACSDKSHSPGTSKNKKKEKRKKTPFPGANIYFKSCITPRVVPLATRK